MFVISCVIVVDFLLPDVHIPLFAYLLIALLWICSGAVREARKFEQHPPSSERLHGSFPRKEAA